MTGMLKNKMKFSEYFSEMIDVFEAFDTSFDSLTWEKHNSGFIGTGQLEDDQFKLFIEPAAPFKVNKKELVWVNIAFARLKDGKFIQELFSTGQAQSKQLGAVIKALVEKLKSVSEDFEIDAIVAFVSAGEEKRIRFYQKIMLSKLYGIRPWQYRHSISWDGNTALISTKRILNKEEFDTLDKVIKAKGKILRGT